MKWQQLHTNNEFYFNTIESAVHHGITSCLISRHDKIALNTPISGAVHSESCVSCVTPASLVAFPGPSSTVIEGVTNNLTIWPFISVKDKNAFAAFAISSWLNQVFKNFLVVNFFAYAESQSCWDNSKN